MAVLIDNMWELKPTTLAVAATEPIHASGLSDEEKRYFVSELKQTIGETAAQKLLDEAHRFHERIHNTKLFQD